MKPVIIAFVALLVVMLGFAWMNGKVGTRPTTKKTTVVGEKEIYWGPEMAVGVGKSQIFEIKANDSTGVVTGYNLEFQFDPALIKVEVVEINQEIFDKKILAGAEATFGKIRMEARSSRAATSLNPGMVTLARVRVTGLKKGVMIVSSGMRPEVTVKEGGKTGEGDFKFKGFRISVQ